MMLAACVAIAASAGGAAAAAEVVPRPAPGLEPLSALHRPHVKLERSISAFRERRREQIRRAMSSRYVLGVPRATLDAIGACESGGDPGAVSSDGSYRGKYQFDRGTWASIGGSGDPAAASEAEQDRRAAMLYARSGSSPWPICG